MTMFFIDSHTESAGTAIEEVIPASGDGIPSISSLIYTSAATAHTITVMRPIGQTSTTAPSASGASTLTLSSVDFGQSTAGADETLAASDYLIWRDQNNTFKFDTVASLSGNVVTMNNALGTDVLNGATVWGCYELARATHEVLLPPVSATTEIKGDIQAGFSVQRGVKTWRTGAGDPLLISINNITAAGTLVSIAGHYVAATDTTTT